MLPGFDGPASFSLASGRGAVSSTGGCSSFAEQTSSPSLLSEAVADSQAISQRRPPGNGQFVVLVAVQVRSSTRNARFRRLTTLPQVL